MRLTKECIANSFSAVCFSPLSLVEVRMSPLKTLRRLHSYGVTFSFTATLFFYPTPSPTIL